MTDHKNTTPEEEAALVPDWIENIRGDWFDISDSGDCKRFLWMDADTGKRLCMDTEVDTMALSSQGAEIVSKALQFFAATGRLPRGPMTDQYSTIRIKKRFDKDGKPSCDGCPVQYTDYSGWLSAMNGRQMCPFIYDETNPMDEDCPVHNPKPDPL